MTRLLDEAVATVARLPRLSSLTRSSPVSRPGLPGGPSRVFDRIEAVLALVRDHPGIGQAGDRPGVQRIVVNPNPTVILYQPTAREVIVHAVRHAARTPSRW